MAKLLLGKEVNQRLNEEIKYRANSCNSKNW